MSVQVAPVMAQGRKINMAQMDEAEFEKILQVLQKDFELRQKEQERLSKIQEDLEEENNKASVLAKKTKLNENVCIRCCQTFGIIFNRKQTCQICKLHICKSCCLYDRENKGYICHICAKDKELKLKSCEWFYDNVSKKFKRFGSAKVVRTLYKQKRRDSARRYHTDNESDSGYDPSLLTSTRFGSLQSLDRLHQQVEGAISDTEGFDPVIPAPVQFGPSVKPHPNKDINRNISNDSETESRHSDGNDHPKKEVADIYKEAFENAKTAEEKKFHGRFDLFMSEFQKSLVKLLSNGVNPNYSNTGYSDVMVNYRGKLKDLLVSLSQRLEIVIESFDSSSDDPLETSLKVRQLISKLVADSLGESIDLGSEEAVSDLSSLSGESSDPVKSYEDQLAHLVVTKVLENHKRENHLDFCLDELDGRKDEVDQARNSSFSEEKSDTDRQYDSESQHSDIDKCDTDRSFTRKRQSSERENQNIHECTDASIQCEPYVEEKHYVVRERPPSVNEVVQCDLQYENNSLDNSNLDHESLDHFQPEQIVKTESVKSVGSGSPNLENEFEKLRSFAMDLSSSRNQTQTHEIEEYLDEEPIAEEKIDRDEGRQEFASRFDTFDRVHDDTRISLPSLDDYDYEYGSGEVDPDLLSMNLAPIMEEDENEIEDDLEAGQGEKEEGQGERDWKGNWILKSSSGITPYKNMAKNKTVEGISQVYMTIPQPNQHMSPKIGHRDIDQMSDFSDNTDLSDEESSFYEQTSAEISRITKNSHKNKLRTSSVQTDDSEAEEVRSRTSSVSRSICESSADESIISKKKKLIEEYVPADGDDPKFEIPPESLEVPEGEPAKFMLRVGGTQPINVFWYKVEEDLVELMESEQYVLSRDGNRCYLTIYNPVRDDAGQYMAIGINEKGQCCQYMILTVKKNKQELKKPEFLKDIQDIDATEGQTVKFRCKVKGYPQPRICWYKDGKLLASDDCYKIEKFGNRDYILTIDFASMDDDAEYTVVATNIAGEAKSVAQLIVDTDEVKPTRPIRKLPTPLQHKDDQHLTNLNRKMYETKAEVTHAAEDLLTTANELTDIHKSLDEVDHMLSSFEHDLDTANTSDITNNNWADTMLSHNLGHDAVMNYQKMKKAAENVRKMTNRAIGIVESTDNLVENNSMDCLATSTPRSSEESIHSPRVEKDKSSEHKPKWLQFVKEDGDITIPSLNTSQVSDDSYSDSFNQPMETSESVHVPLSIDTADHVTSKMENFMVSAKPNEADHAILENNKNKTNLNQQDVQTFDTSLDSSYISCDLNDNISETEPAEVVNFGAKPVQAEFYSRDYIINNNNVPPNKPPRKKWEVKTDSYSPKAEIINRHNDLDNIEEKIYMSASKISNLQSKIQDLEQEVSNTHSSDKRRISDLEEDIAHTVAQTCRSEHDVGSLGRSVEALQVSCPTSPRSMEDDNSNMSSPSLSIDSGFSSIRERPQPTLIIGSTGEEDLPESRTELNEETGVELPSVNRLKQLFGSSGDGDGSFKRNSDGPVHSITARTLGKEKVDKIRTMAKTVNQPSPLALKPTSHPSPLASEPVNQTSGRSHISVTLAPVSQTKINNPQPKQIFPKNKGEYYPAEKPNKSDNVTKSVEPQPINKTVASSKTSRAPPPPSESTKGQKSTTAQGEPEPKKGGSRIRAGCINARAKFWEKKIQGDSPSTEEEFPSMVEQVPE